MEKKRKSVLVALMLLAVFCGAVLGAMIYKYQISKPTYITVSMNSWKIELFTDELCTIVADSINFASLEESIGGAMNTSTYYLKNIAELRNIYPQWNHTSLPAGITLTSWITLGGTDHPLGPNGVCGLPIDSSNGWQAPIWWQVTITSSVLEGAYNCTIDIFAIQNT